MALTGIQKASTFAITDAMVNTQQLYQVQVDPASGIQYVGLAIALTPVGSGTFTLDKQAAIGFINSLVCKDQNGNN